MLADMELQPDQCYEILKARDARYDGVFFVGVSTTGVYCRPVCRVRLPLRDRCSFYPSAAAAEVAGFRPCLKCRPELAPGTKGTPVDRGADVARAAARRIEDGALDERNLTALAAELGVSPRQLSRLTVREYGVPPGALARTRRLLLAKQLLTDTDMKVVDVAFAAGFSSLRQFNRAFAHHYRLSPRAFRRPARQPGPDDEDSFLLKFGFRPPYDWSGVRRFLAAHAISSVDQVTDRHYRRAVRLGAHTGWIAAEIDREAHLLRVQTSVSLAPVLPRLAGGMRRLFDLDAAPDAIAAHLAADGRLARLLKARPGIRLPGAFDGLECGLAAVLGPALCARLAGRFGMPLETPWAEVSVCFPAAGDIAFLPLQALLRIGLTASQAQTATGMARAVSEGTLRLEGTDHAGTVRARLAALAGLPPGAVDEIAARILGDTDAWPFPGLSAPAENWRPWRAYGAMALWLDQPLDSAA